MKDLPSRSKKLRTPVLIFLALVLLAGLVIYDQLFLFNPDKLPRGDVIPNGGEAYAISQGILTDGPKFKEVDITPRKVSLGDTQLLIVKMERPEETASVKAATELDSSVKEINLTKTDNNEWRGEWVVEDTSTKTYRTTFVALGKDGKENRFTMAWSDPCSGVPTGGDGTLSADCTISGVDGVDNGNLNLNGRTLTIPSGATFAWNSGKTITANGTIAVSGQLKKTKLWIKDADNDGYAPNSTDQLAQDTQPASYQRRYSRTGTADCNDADVTKWQNLSGYQDSDGDSYGAGSAQNVCSGSSLAAGYVSNSSDCYDSNANAKPGQTGTFTSNRGDGSFDYNCDGSITPSFTYHATEDYPTSGQYSCYHDVVSSQCGVNIAYCAYYNDYQAQGGEYPYHCNAGTSNHCNAANYVRSPPLVTCMHCRIGDYTNPTRATLACR